MLNTARSMKILDTANGSVNRPYTYTELRVVSPLKKLPMLRFIQEMFYARASMQSHDPRTE
jgi:hypothetical protein